MEWELEACERVYKEIKEQVLNNRRISDCNLNIYKYEPNDNDLKILEHRIEALKSNLITQF